MKRCRFWRHKWKHVYRLNWHIHSAIGLATVGRARWVWFPNGMKCSQCGKRK